MNSLKSIENRVKIIEESDIADVIRSVSNEYGEQANDNDFLVQALARKIVHMNSHKFTIKALTSEEWRVEAIKSLNDSQFYEDQFITKDTCTYMSRLEAINHVIYTTKKRKALNGVLIDTSKCRQHVDEGLCACEVMDSHELKRYNRIDTTNSFFKSYFNKKDGVQISLNNLKSTFFKEINIISDKLFHNRLKAWVAENDYDLEKINRGVKAKIIITKTIN